MAVGEEDLLKVGSVAAALGVTPRTLRFYEQEGLLEAVRSPAGTRFYRARDLARLRAILDLAAAGIPLQQIRRLAAERGRHETGDASRGAVDGMLATLERETEERLTRLSALREDIRLARGLLDGCRRCLRVPDSAHCPDCPVRQGRAHSRLASLIWDQAD